VGVFPEGHLTRDGELQPFRPGISRILAANPVPVVPMALSGLWGSFFSRIDGSAMQTPFRRGVFSDIALQVGAPVPPGRRRPSICNRRCSPCAARAEPRGQGLGRFDGEDQRALLQRVEVDPPDVGEPGACQPVGILAIAVGLGAGFVEQGQPEGAHEGVVRRVGQVFVDDQQAAGVEGVENLLDGQAVFVGVWLWATDR
jgi:hypothetical protein